MSRSGCPLFVAAAGAVCAWSAGAFRSHRLRRPRQAEAWPGRGPVSVVIPARDEAGSLPALLDTLAAQSLPPAEVIVVDDGSTDGTGDLARRAGATVVRVEGPPPGWLGKPWACHQGALAATGDRIVFLDADVRLDADALAALVDLHDESGGGLVSVQPYHEAGSGAEQLSALFNAVAVLGSGEFAWWHAGGARTGRSVHRSGRRAAFGPCLVTGRATYLALGGHGAVRARILEDMALARAYAAVGQPVTCRLGGELVRFRMYPDGLRPLLDGWTKNIAVGAAGAHRPASLATAGWITASVAVATWTATAGVRRVAGGPRPGGAALAWLATAATFGAVLRPLGSFRAATALLFPVPLACFVGVFARAAAISATGRDVRWKGRTIPTAPRQHPSTCPWSSCN